MSEDTCDVTVSLGVTKNLGNFESIRFDVSLRLTGQDKEALYDEATAWVGKKVKDFQGGKKKDG